MRDRHRVPHIEAVRGVAALAILVYHSTQLTDGEGAVSGATDRFWLGVPLFFVLSGFLLYRPFLRATMYASEWPSLRRYGRSRLLRIAPAYLLALTAAIFLTRMGLIPVALAVVASGLWVRARLGRTSKLVPLFFTLVATVAWIGTTDRTTVLWEGSTNYLLIFTSVGASGVIGPCWSLCIEIAFYVALPGLAFAIHSVARRGATPSTRALRAAGMIALTIPVGLVYVSFTGTALADGLPAHIDLFAVGMLLAISAERWPGISPRSSRQLLFGGIALAVATQPLFDVGSPIVHSNGSSAAYRLAMTSAFALILGSVLLAAKPTLVGRLLATRPLVAVGAISYGVFLWHFPLIVVLRETPLWTMEIPNTFLVLGLTLGAAAASWFLVEKRALALKDRPLPVGRLLRQRESATPAREVALAD